MTDKVRAALDAYAAASGERGDDQYFLWNMAWSLMDHCDKHGMDFVAIVEEARSERARIAYRESGYA